ncbi:uncharacterized protein LOC141641541 [Silene latifolia]|uniref:uncharacterized protein LOC141641541 n=1 Tax=Silene latifolia TaxID=37657 RepID=UPI003D76C2AF
MESISKPFNGKNYWKKRGYNLLDGAAQTKRNMPVIQIRGNKVTNKKTRFWRIKKSAKLASLKKVFVSPKNLWQKFKNGYINMMLRMAGDTGKINGGSEFGKKKISQARNVRVKYKNFDEFEARIVLEIYRSLSTSKGYSEIA